MASFQAKIGSECRDGEEIKIASPFRSYPTGNKKFKKKKKKKNKKIK